MSFRASLACLILVPCLLGQGTEFPFTTNSQAMVDAANQFGAGFVPAADQPSAVLVDADVAAQPLVIELICPDAASPRPHLSAPQRISAGQFQFLLTSDPGRNFLIQWSSNRSNWQPLGVLTNTSGTSSVLDSNTAGSPIRYYRAREP